MFTKLFKKSHDPYELGGRWYKFTISSDKDTGYFSVVKSDIPVFDEDAPALGYIIEDNSLYVVKGYIIDYAFMTLSGALSADNIHFGNAIDSEHGTTSNFTGEGLNGSLFDLYLYIVKSNGTQNVSSGSDSGSDSGSGGSGSGDHNIH